MTVEYFDNDWTIHWENRTITCISPNKERNYTVTNFWRWARKMEASESGMAYPYIVDTDGMGSSYNIPRKVRLANGWTISKESIQYLKGSDSVLFSENNQLLISDNLRTKNWWENSYVQGLLIVLAIAGLVISFI